MRKVLLYGLSFCLVLSLLVIIVFRKDEPVSTTEVDNAPIIQSPIAATPTAPATPAVTILPTAPMVSAPVYIDESKYSGEELSLIKLINLRVKYMNEADQEQYWALFSENAPFDKTLSDTFPSYTILGNEIEGEISITEQKSIFQAVIAVQETRSNGNNGNKMYVFQKGKDPNAEWIIADID